MPNVDAVWLWRVSLPVASAISLPGVPASSSRPSGGRPFSLV